MFFKNRETCGKSERVHGTLWNFESTLDQCESKPLFLLTSSLVIYSNWFTLVRIPCRRSIDAHMGYARPIFVRALDVWNDCKYTFSIWWKKPRQLKRMNVKWSADERWTTFIVIVVFHQRHSNIKSYKLINSFVCSLDVLMFDDNCFAIPVDYWFRNKTPYSGWLTRVDIWSQSLLFIRHKTNVKLKLSKLIHSD